MSLFAYVVKHLPPTYSQAKTNNERLSFSRPTALVTRSFWSHFDHRLAQLEQHASAVEVSLKPCCDHDLAATLLSEIRTYQAYNQVISASVTSDLVQPFPVITLPRFWQCSNAVHEFVEAIDERDQFSRPMRVKVGGRTKYGYFVAYGKEDEPQLGSVPDAEQVRMIEQSIAKNRSDANAIFKYTQWKRASRWLRNSKAKSYFSQNEAEADKYDLSNIRQGPLPCWGSAMLFHSHPAGRDQFGACTSGTVRISGLPSSMAPSQQLPPLPGGFENGVAVTMIGHASMLIQFELEGITVLTDPVFHHLNSVLYPRQTRPSCSLHDLPHVDVIVISHNHRDHVDEAALRYLAKQQPLILVPEGDGPLMRSWGFLKVEEHSTWAETRIPFKRAPFPDCEEHGDSEDSDFSGHVGLVSVPANHWSCRSLNDANHSLFLGWVMYSSAGTGSVYFAGDTALLAEQDVRDIVSTAVCKHIYPPIMVNLQPGGPNHERATMEGTHTSAADGVFNHFQHVLMATKTERSAVCSFAEFLDLSYSYLTMYMHHNVFELGIDRFNEALFVQRHLLNAIGVLQGADETTVPSIGIQERIPAFVHDVAGELLQLLESCGIEHRLRDADSDHLARFSALVEARVLSPKIGSTIFVPYPSSPLQ